MDWKHHTTALLSGEGLDFGLGVGSEATRSRFLVCEETKDRPVEIDDWPDFGHDQVLFEKGQMNLLRGKRPSVPEYEGQVRLATAMGRVGSS
jgi:hypothetical protein